MGKEKSSNLNILITHIKMFRWKFHLSPLLSLSKLCPLWESLPSVDHHHHLRCSITSLQDFKTQSIDLPRDFPPASPESHMGVALLFLLNLFLLIQLGLSYGIRGEIQNRGSKNTYQKALNSDEDY